MNNEAPRPRAKNLPHTLTPSYITLSSGDIKDLPKTVTNLNLERCEELTGKEKRAMAQSNTLRTSPHVSHTHARAPPPLIMIRTPEHRQYRRSAKEYHVPQSPGVL